MPLPDPDLVSPESALPPRVQAQLRAARRLLGLPLNPNDVDDVRDPLAMIDMAERHWIHGRAHYSKKTKRALENVLAAIKRVERAYAALPEDYYFFGDIDPIDWKKHVAMFEHDLHAKPKAPLKYIAYRKQRAAEMAYQLMRAHNVPVSSHRKGKFCRLAAILYGDQQENCYSQCREILQRKKPPGKGRL
jgi:hypothetical protein